MIDYKEFFLIPAEQDGAQIVRIRRKDARPFVVGRAVNHEFSTMPFADTDEAIENAKLIADSALLQ
jgi:hypothetical protein